MPHISFRVTPEEKQSYRKLIVASKVSLTKLIKDNLGALLGKYNIQVEEDVKT
jgi:hypothetical protein